MSSKATASSPSVGSAPNPATTQMALTIAERLDQKQATDIKILDVSGPLVIADYFVVATVKSTRQAQALARELDMEHKTMRGRRRRNTGGAESADSNWVLLDFNDIVVHLFLPEARQYYGLEELWADVPRVPFTPAPRSETTELGTEVRQPTFDGFGAFQPMAGATTDDEFDDDASDDDGLDDADLEDDELDEDGLDEDGLDEDGLDEDDDEAIDDEPEGDDDESKD